MRILGRFGRLCKYFALKLPGKKSRLMARGDHGPMAPPRYATGYDHGRRSWGLGETLHGNECRGYNTHSPTEMLRPTIFLVDNRYLLIAIRLEQYLHIFIALIRQNNVLHDFYYCLRSWEVCHPLKGQILPRNIVTTVSSSYRGRPHYVSEQLHLHSKGSTSVGGYGNVLQPVGSTVEEEW